MQDLLQNQNDQHDDYNETRQLYEQVLNDKNALEEQLREKDTVLEFVEQEIQKIRDQQDDDSNRVKDKERVIVEMTRLMQDKDT